MDTIQSDEFDRSFRTLKLFTCSFLQNRSEEELTRLRNVLTALPSVHVAVMQDYILFPLRLVLRESVPPIKESFACAILECCQYTLKRAAAIERWASFCDLFSQLFMLLSSDDGATSLLPVSVAYTCAVLETVSVLVSVLPQSLLKNLYDDAFMPVLGHAVFLCLKVLETATDLKLKLCTLRCLRVLSFCNSTEMKPDHVATGALVAAAFASFLPGISIGLAKQATCDVIQNHQVVVECLQLWAHVVVLVLSVSPCTTVTSVCIADTPKPKGTLRVARTDEWFKETVQNLRILVQRIPACLLLHGHWEVRRALLRWAAQLLDGLCCAAPDKFAAWLSVLLDTVLSLREDAFDEVQQEANVYSEGLVAACCADEYSERWWVHQVAEENLYGLCERLPQLARQSGERELQLRLASLLGYLRLLTTLPDGMNRFSNSHTHMRKLLLALCQLMQFDYSRVALVAEVDNRNLEISAGTVTSDHCRPERYFLLFKEKHTVDLLNDILGCFAVVDNAYLTVTNVLSDIGTDLTMFGVQALYLQNILLRALSHRSDGGSEFIEHVHHLIDEYMDAMVALPLDLCPQDDVPAQDVAGPSRDSLHLTLLLEALADACLVFGHGDLQRLRRKLLDILFPVLNCLTSTNVSVVDWAMCALHDIAVASHYTTISACLVDNVDYLVHSLTIKLRHYSLYPRAPLVLVVMLQHCKDKAMLPKIKDIVTEVLFAVDDNYMERCVVFMKVLLAFARAVENWFPGDSIAHDTSMAPALEVVGAGDDDDMEERQPAPPMHVAITVLILQRTKHLVASPHLPVRLIVLHVLALAFRILQPWQDELLPMVHQTWPGLVARFARSEHLNVTAEAFEVVCMIAEVSGTFVYRRCVDDLLPKVCAFLQQHAKDSERTGAIYEQSAMCRLQVAYLKGLPSLLANIKLLSKDVDPLLAVCKLYVNDGQPRHLQTLAADLVTSLHNHPIDEMVC